VIQDQDDLNDEAKMSAFKAGRPSFGHKAWPHISQPCKDLIT
jgi:hypothetical protein